MSGPADLAAVLRGSHTALIEARLVPRFQTGPDPDGEALDVIDGEVVLDGTAQVRATLRLTVAGTTGQHGRSRWPHLADRDTGLAPWGPEIFVRRGVRLPGGTHWVSLGYFGIDTIEQSRRSRDSISVTASDRMAPVIDSKLVAPRQYGPTTTVAEVYDDLVGELYPQARIAFADNTGQALLDRAVVCEEHRYDTVADLAHAHGQLAWWDGEGVLRVEATPRTPITPVWTVDAGPHGVLVEHRRRLSRDGAVGAVVARGETAGTTDPVQAVAYDTDPRSPTRWGGPLGMVPYVYASAAITTTGQAQRAAEAILRRSRGRPRSIDFGAIVNPAITPWQAVEVIGDDARRERHLIERAAIPLVIDAAMTATTRDQTALPEGDAPQ